ncbi:hypothetical protein FLA_4030 [Filimonas lacunae]|nr:hypothetical protein FLA_4030 [Filimonas lacunae]
MRFALCEMKKAPRFYNRGAFLVYIIVVINAVRLQNPACE